MALTLDFLEKLTGLPTAEVWSAIFEYSWAVCSQPIGVATAANEVTRRDRELAELDLFLASAGWDLWSGYEGSVQQTAEEMTVWWASQPAGCAVLILDGLSLREAPWLLQGASDRGYEIMQARATGSELPAETNEFARALGFNQRSALENNGAGTTHRLAGARTDTGGIPWGDCSKLVGSEPKWVFWHHWPDHRAHELGVAGQGLGVLAAEVVAQLQSDAFWQFLERLSTGRRLLITSDHGYAASGLFPDTASPEQASHLKDIFKSGRVAPTTDTAVTFVPPIDLPLQTRHGLRRYTVGRRKWKSQGGYPTLTHGGLSVLEIASPFIELRRAS